MDVRLNLFGVRNCDVLSVRQSVPQNHSSCWLCRHIRSRVLPLKNVSSTKSCVDWDLMENFCRQRGGQNVWNTKSLTGSSMFQTRTLPIDVPCLGFSNLVVSQPS
ncbi:hypothetical protein T265_06576 [Opisthorchis viverrini]|uniref:Uncharacterized protein n=1 Tax=Opisthorchis viverrini TaxID=6198 RepID=A0A074ZFN9_OPIVI|nr:hypothetical protein T265_06576 [Opisthorchis viverrini]KER26096.1 hypothetical protein T265_06576 [Opisthorchis viverrini]